jgi:multisubunit Na+/H+ antiporter MnhB subunit
MGIVERREHEGAWWGRDASGVWYRWSTASGSWDGPLAPPWPPEPPPLTPEEEAIVAAALATTASPEGPPMNRVDTWWNRTFPPFSKKRLVFGLAALPVVSALQELVIWVIGRRPSLPRYLFVCIAGGVMLSVAFLPGMRDIAERLAKARTSTNRSMWPWRRSGEAAPPPEPVPQIERNFGRDFLIALPFAVVIILVMSLTVAGPGDTFAPRAILTNTLAALFTAALVALRTSVWGLALFSIAGGLLGGLFLVLLSAMTFSDPGGDFLVGWAIGSVLLFLYAYPMWRWMRNLEARGFRLPMWIVMGGSVVLISGSALMFIAEH